MLAYEGLCQAFKFIYQKRPLDPLMVIATLSTVYPNFYAFFCTWNYINDRFFDMMATQVLRCGSRRDHWMLAG